jgi:hypothetical protein
MYLGRRVLKIFASFLRAEKNVSNTRCFQNDNSNHGYDRDYREEWVINQSNHSSSKMIDYSKHLLHE